jgi:hypothetical protein
MNADIFEEYFESLCQHCKDQFDDTQVIFVMDNAKYHRRESQSWKDTEETMEGDPDEDSERRTLSNLKRGQLVKRLCSLGVENDKISNLTRAKLYEMAKRPEFKIPLATEVTARR